jgi:hypothetical protein
VTETLIAGERAYDRAALAEVPPPAPRRTPALTERQLFEIWRGQRFPAGALVTRQGVPVRVISPGRPGRGPGPDFRGAAIAGPSEVTLRGDVELHVRSSLFQAHGHAADRAYADVVLHVVFEDDTGADTPLPGGRTAPVVALAPWVARRAGELQRWLERPLLWREPCHDAVMRKGLQGVTDVLDAEGDRRFEEKARRFAEMIAASGLEQAVYEGLMEALGYGGNAAPMRALACLLPWPRLRAVTSGAQPGLRTEAALIGAAGLLPSQRGHRGPVEAYVTELERAFGAPGAVRGVRALPAAGWKLWGVRPENHPVRRIAAAAALFGALPSPSSLLGVVRANTVREAIASLLLPSRGFWLRRYDVCVGPCALPPAFVGRSRALEMLVNVVLPAAAASGDGALAGRAWSLYGQLPRPAVYGATKFLENALASEGIRVPVNARRAQGLLGLQRSWCTRDGCGRCALS